MIHNQSFSSSTKITSARNQKICLLPSNVLVDTNKDVSGMLRVVCANFGYFAQVYAHATCYAYVNFGYSLKISFGQLYDFLLYNYFDGKFFDKIG